jgi:hypothetical protein
MNRRTVLLVGVLVGLAACGDRKAEPADTSAPQAAPVSTDALSATDRAAVLKVAALAADEKGQVENECGEKVTPQLLPADLGPAVGPAVLLVMSGGPNYATCYGDGPGLTLMRRDGASWRHIYSSRGGSLVIMKEMHNGAPDLVHGGPGFSHPVFEWNGTVYTRADREVPDDQISGATILP